MNQSTYTNGQLITSLDNVLAPLVFDDVKPIEIEVTIPPSGWKSPREGVGRNFLLKEAFEDVAIRYRAASMRNARMKDGSISGLDGAADADAVLVAGCLFEITDPSANRTMYSPLAGLRPVTVEEARSLSHRLFKTIYERAKRISELDDAPDSVEALDREIVRLTHKRDKLMGGDSPPKDGVTSTPEFST